MRKISSTVRSVLGDGIANEMYERRRTPNGSDRATQIEQVALRKRIQRAGMVRYECAKVKTRSSRKRFRQRGVAPGAQLWVGGEDAGVEVSVGVKMAALAA